MDFFPPRWVRRLRALGERSRLEREMDEEMRFHVEMEARELSRTQGLSPEEARRRAMIAFGGVEGHKEEGRSARGYGWLTGVSLDLKLGLRMLRKHAALSVIGGLGMAVAIAIAAGFFTFMAGFYYSHPPLDEGERIVALENQNLMDMEDWRASLFDYHTWRETLTSVDELAAFRKTYPTVHLPGGASGRAPVAEMTASGFQLARVPPLLGRPLLETDELEGATPVVVIGHREWQEEFGGDRGVLGREVRLDGASYRVVGVMPEGFRFPLNHGYWTALRTSPSLYGPGEGPKIFVFGRLAPGVSEASAQAELTAAGERMSAERPAVYEHLRPTILAYVHPLLDVQQYPAWLVWAMQLFAILVLTVVAVNVAVLVYARTASRRGEITVRTALGAGRGRIVTQLFMEALALSLLAAALGLLIADFAYRQIFALSNTEFLPYWIGGGLPAATIPYAIGLAVVAAVLVGVLPALRATGRNLQATLREVGGGNTGLRMGSTWTTLIVVQVAIAVAVLPVVVAMAASTIWRPLPAPTFPAGEVLTFSLSRERDPFAAQRQELDAAFAGRQAELIERVATEPGVVAVTYARAQPRSGERVRFDVDPGATGVPGPAVVNAVDLDYFDALGVPLLAGRQFQAGDLAEDASAVIVNRTFADRFLGGGNVVGRQIREMRGVGRDADRTEPWYEIVGVVGDMYQNRVRPELDQAAVYHPTAVGAEALRVAARTRGITPADLAPRVRELGARVAPDWPVTAMAMDDLYSGPDRETRGFTALVFGLMVLSVLLLSAAGISALMSFAVTRRQREIGVRVALGATRGRIVAAIFSRSARQIALGLLAGAVAGGMLDRLAGGELLGGRALILLPAVAAMMLVAGMLATLGPARRALRIHPMDALRQE